MSRLIRSLLAKLLLSLPFLWPLLASSAPLTRIDFPGGSGSKTLIVFLPGIADTARDFENHGFIADLRSHGVRADAVAVDAHYQYYARRDIVERLREDIIDPARTAGYEKIWLVGISLGGFGASLYAAQEGKKIAGMLLLSPYPGPDTLIEEISGAGGLGKWRPDAGTDDPAQRGMWAWFAAQTRDADSSPRIYLGYGKSDKFAPANGLLAAALPSSHVYAIPGAHNWRTWRAIWIKFLESQGGELR
jgi:pimeloyl-ACP methyl ester carboxylesterase